MVREIKERSSLKPETLFEVLSKGVHRIDIRLNKPLHVDFIDMQSICGDDMPAKSVLFYRYFGKEIRHYPVVEIFG